jgi:hypothetical protein
MEIKTADFITEIERDNVGDIRAISPILHMVAFERIVSISLLLVISLFVRLM